MFGETHFLAAQNIDFIILFWMGIFSVLPVVQDEAI